MARRTPDLRSSSQTPIPLSWNSTFTLSPLSPPSSLTGDKVLLPPSVLEALLSAASSSVLQRAQQALRESHYNPASWDYLPPDEILAQQREHGQQLPHPLTFNIVNTANGKVIHAGVREFSAEDGEVVLSSYLRQALDIDSEAGEDVKMADGVEESVLQLSVSYAALPKGTYAKLQPLEAGYDEDFRPLLEVYLRKNFTTLTVKDTLSVPSANGQSVFRFLVAELKPADAVCVVDTDLNVDIGPLDEEQAKETLKRRAANGVMSSGGEVAVGKAVRSSVGVKGYTHFQLKKWDKSKPVRVEVQVLQEGDEVDVVATTEKLYRKPSVEEHGWNNFSDKYPKHLQLEADKNKDAEEFLISVYGYSSIDDEGNMAFNLLVTQHDDDQDADEELESTATDPDREICSNCKQAIPKRTMFLHQNFCLRNNILCTHGCGQVFKRGTETLHWHCDDCSSFGTNASDSTDTRSKHIFYAHTATKCGFCDYSAGSIPELSSHKTTECPGKLILCRFCHLILPQEGDAATNSSNFLTDLSPHEVACGSRTTDCHICNRIVQLKQLDVHLRNHDLDRKSKPLPRICRNINCCRTAAQPPGHNQLDLCGICNGPLYSATHDPDGSALSRRVQRKYLTQMLVGCNMKWCTNPMCKTGRGNVVPPLEKITGTKEATALFTQYCDAGTLNAGYTAGPLHFCVDEGTSERRKAAERLSMMQDSDGKGGWALEWCVKAVEESGKAGEPEGGFEEGGLRWLEKFGVRRDE